MCQLSFPKEIGLLISILQNLSIEFRSIESRFEDSFNSIFLQNLDWNLWKTSCWPNIMFHHTFSIEIIVPISILQKLCIEFRFMGRFYRILLLICLTAARWLRFICQFLLSIGIHLQISILQNLSIEFRSIESFYRIPFYRISFLKTHLIVYFYIISAWNLWKTSCWPKIMFHHTFSIEIIVPISILQKLSVEFRFIGRFYRILLLICLTAARWFRFIWQFSLSIEIHVLISILQNLFIESRSIESCFEETHFIECSY